MLRAAQIDHSPHGGILANFRPGSTHFPCTFQYPFGAQPLQNISRHIYGQFNPRRRRRRSRRRRWRSFVADFRPPLFGFSSSHGNCRLKMNLKMFVFWVSFLFTLIYFSFIRLKRKLSNYLKCNNLIFNIYTCYLLSTKKIYAVF